MDEKTLAGGFQMSSQVFLRRCDCFSKHDRYLDWMKYELADLYYQQDDS